MFYNPSYGGVAQGLEQSAHNRLVVGSNPTAPTIEIRQSFDCLISINEEQAVGREPIVRSFKESRENPSLLGVFRGDAEEKSCEARRHPTAPTRFYSNRQNGRFFSDNCLLSTLQVLGCNIWAFLQQKTAKNTSLAPVKMPINTLTLECVFYYL